MTSVHIVAACLLIGCVSWPTEARYIKRSTTIQECSRSTPCGWEVYRPYVRTIDYFIKSPCECPEGTICVRTSDDLSISAYVHRCRPENEAGPAWPFDSHTSDTVGEPPSQ